MATEERTTWPAFRSCRVRNDAVPLHEAARMIAHRQVRGSVHLFNAYTLSLASKDAKLAQVLEQSTLNLPDGMPLIWIARRLGLDHMTERVYGPDLMHLVLDPGQRTGFRHYLYGSTPEVLDALQHKLSCRWPNALVTGVESPPFRGISDSELKRSVRQFETSGADVVWVGMGTPAQDTISRRMAEIGASAYVAVGAAFDFIGETKRQAPPWMQR